MTSGLQKNICCSLMGTLWQLHQSSRSPSACCLPATFHSTLATPKKSHLRSSSSRGTFNFLCIHICVIWLANLAVCLAHWAAIRVGIWTPLISAKQGTLQSSIGCPFWGMCSLKFTPSWQRLIKGCWLAASAKNIEKCWTKYFTNFAVLSAHQFRFRAGALLT